MSQTVVGFFDDHSQARQALEELHSGGISRERIDISRGAAAQKTGGNSSRKNTDVNPVSGSERDENSVRRTSEGETVDPDGRNTNVFTDFFNNLFGSSDNSDAGRYSHVAQRAEAVVTVHAQSREEAERAAEIMDDCGAMDVDKKASESGYSGSSSSSDRLSGNTTGSMTSNENPGSGNPGLRSRIFDRRLDENNRLRDFDNE